jgi:hypothetical protein
MAKDELNGIESRMAEMDKTTIRELRVFKALLLTKRYYLLLMPSIKERIFGNQNLN